MAVAIRLLILDVDGVLTPGSLPYGQDGNIEKVFYVHDGTALRLWREAGGRVAIISGRQSPAVDRRADDLGIDSVTQGVSDKIPAYESIRRRLNIDDSAISVVGDDLLDLAPMRRCGYPIAVANAVPVVKRAARYVTRRCGGAGGVREAIERLLRHNATGPGIMKKRNG